MSRNTLHMPHLPNTEVPDEFDPGSPPVEPDEGPVPSHIPDDPEHERVIDPGENTGQQSLSMYHQVEAARCL
jgi:hypothetical protein